MKAKRDRLKPRSRNLAGACKGLVAGLEKGFDGMDTQASKSCREQRMRTIRRRGDGRPSSRERR